MDECAVYGLKFLDPNVEVPRSPQSHLYPASSPEADSGCGVPQHHTYMRQQYGDYEEPNTEWPEKERVILIASIEKGKADIWDFLKE